LLQGLPFEDRMSLLATGRKRTFLAGQTIGAYGTQINAVLFIESGVVAATVPMQGGETLEAFTIGDEGVTGGWAGQTRGAYRLVTRSEVNGIAVDAKSLHTLCAQRQSVRGVLMEYGARLSVELAQNSLCNLCHRTEERMSKWLLRQHDRLHQAKIDVTVQGLADILGVQRKASRAAMESLRTAGIIEVRRAAVEITDRDGLETRVCECYDADRSVRDAPRSVVHDAETVTSEISRIGGR
jgi:CRP-like cAMP-binding protein